MPQPDCIGVVLAIESWIGVILTGLLSIAFFASRAGNGARKIIGLFLALQCAAVLVAMLVSWWSGDVRLARAIGLGVFLASYVTVAALLPVVARRSGP